MATLTNTSTEPLCATSTHTIDMSGMGSFLVFGNQRIRMSLVVKGGKALVDYSICMLVNILFLSVIILFINIQTFFPSTERAISIAAFVHVTLHFNRYNN